MSEWKITIEAWPHSTGVGADEDQKAAGERVNTFIVNVEDFQDAVRAAKHIALGIEAHPRVWRAPVISVTQCRT